MVGKIFISYRRDDARADARSLYQGLQRRFGSQNLFMDVDTIEKGRDFRKILDQHLSQCETMLVVIGKRWWEIGEKRLSDPADFVRLEIESALSRDIAVIPVLVDGAELPSSEQLPPSLEPLLYRQAARITHDRFASDLAALERDVLSALRQPGYRTARARRAAALVVAVAVPISAGLAYFYAAGLPSGGGQPAGARTQSAVSPQALPLPTAATQRPSTDLGSPTAELKGELPAKAPPRSELVSPQQQVSPAVATATSGGLSATGFEIEIVAGLVGRQISTANFTTDASNPQPAVSFCAGRCSASAVLCAGFEISVVHNKCTTYATVERKVVLGGYIAGVRK